MTSLNLEKALELYSIIGKHLPENVDENLDVLDFIGTIVNNIKESGNHRDYVNAVSIMTDLSISELLEMGYEEILGLFIEGLIINQIISLKKFCESINYA